MSHDRAADRIRPDDQTIVVWGAGGHAKVALEALSLSGQRVVALVDDTDRWRDGQVLAGIRVYPTLEPVLELGVRRLFVAIGGNTAREAKARAGEQLGLRLVTVVHPRAIVSTDAAVAAGTIVMAGAVVQPGCRVGRNVIVNTLAGIDHDCILGDGVHVAPGAHVAGRVTIGRGAWIGIGASVRDGVTIGEGALVGSGAAVVADVPPRVVVVGVPGRVVRDVEPGERL